MRNNDDVLTHTPNPGSIEHAGEGPRIIGVQLAHAHEFSKRPRTSIRLVENHGVEGDAHAGRTDQHLFHIRCFGAQPNLRQVHLIQAEFFDEVAQQGHTVCAGDLGENVTTRGVDLLALPTGTRLRLGSEALIELTGLRNPCHQIENFQEGLLALCKEATPERVLRKAGVMAVVPQGGAVKPGDGIAVTLPPRPHEALVYRIYRTPTTDRPRGRTAQP